jgi:hypothetical protein
MAANKHHEQRMRLRQPKRKQEQVKGPAVPQQPTEATSCGRTATTRAPSTTPVKPSPLVDYLKGIPVLRTKTLSNVAHLWLHCKRTSRRLCEETSCGRTVEARASPNTPVKPSPLIDYIKGVPVLRTTTLSFIAHLWLHCRRASRRVYEEV